MKRFTLKPRSWGKGNPLTTSLSKFVTLMLECANLGLSSSVNFCFKKMQVNYLSFNLIPEDTNFFEDFSFLWALLQDAYDAWSERHCWWQVSSCEFLCISICCNEPRCPVCGTDCTNDDPGYPRTCDTEAFLDSFSL